MESSQKNYKLSPAGDGEREFIDNAQFYAFSARVMRLGVQTVLCSGVRS